LFLRNNAVKTGLWFSGEKNVVCLQLNVVCRFYFQVKQSCSLIAYIGESKVQPEYDQNKRVYFFPETRGAAAHLVLVVMAFGVDLLLVNDLVNIH